MGGLCGWVTIFLIDLKRTVFIYYFMYAHVGVLKWRSEDDNLLDLIFSFLHEGPRGRNEEVRLGSKRIYLLSPSVFGVLSPSS